MQLLETLKSTKASKIMVKQTNEQLNKNKNMKSMVIPLIVFGGS